MFSLSFRIVVNVFAWLGLLAVLAVGLALIIGPMWCSGDTCTVQGWFSALSGWAAATAAAATIGILLRQATGAETALAHARDTAERQLRAYVFIDKMYVDAGPDITIHLRFKNTGQTPAYNVRLGHQRTAGLLADLVFKDEFILSVGLDLGPGSTQTATTEFRDLLKIKSDLENGSSVAFVSGVVFYRDAFGKERMSRYRLKVPASALNVGGQLYAAEHGNWSD